MFFCFTIKLGVNTISPTKLTDNHHRKLWIRLPDIYRILQPSLITPHNLALSFPWPWRIDPFPMIVAYIAVVKIHWSIKFLKLANMLCPILCKLIETFQSLSTVWMGIQKNAQVIHSKTDSSNMAKQLFSVHLTHINCTSLP